MAVVCKQEALLRLWRLWRNDARCARRSFHISQQKYMEKVSAGSTGSEKGGGKRCIDDAQKGLHQGV